MAAGSRRRGCTDRSSRRSPRRSPRGRASRWASSSTSGLVDLPYDVANIRAENGPADAHVRIGWFRAVCNNFHAFAAHSFADEMAQAAGRDSLEFLLDMLGPGKILDLKAQGVDYSNYGAPNRQIPARHAAAAPRPRDRGRAIRLGQEKAGRRLGHRHRRAPSFNSYVASVVEVQVDARGAVQVPRIEQVVDAGLIVNPDRVRAQMEGAAVMAVGLARTGEITAAGGRIQQSNFNNFQVARMNDAPRQVNVHFVESDALPTGVGEPGLPPVLAALGNAILRRDRQTRAGAAAVTPEAGVKRRRRPGSCLGPGAVPAV